MPPLKARNTNCLQQAQGPKAGPFQFSTRVRSTTVAYVHGARQLYSPCPDCGCIVGASSHVSKVATECPMNESSRPRIVGINHIALEVGDIEEALAFYGPNSSFAARVTRWTSPTCPNNSSPSRRGGS